MLESRREAAFCQQGKGGRTGISGEGWREDREGAQMLSVLNSSCLVHVKHFQGVLPFSPMSPQPALQTCFQFMMEGCRVK